MEILKIDLNDLRWLVGVRKTDDNRLNNCIYFKMEIEQDDKLKEGHYVILEFLLAMRQGVYFEILSKVIELKMQSTEKYNAWRGNETIVLKCKVEDEPYYAEAIYTVQAYQIEFSE